MKWVVFAFAVVIGAVPALAQRSAHIGIGGGAAIPVGRFDSTYAAGPGGLIMLVGGPRESPLGVRLDYSYNSFRGRDVGGTSYADTHINAVTGDLVVTVRAGYLKPYVLGGIGWYPYREAGDTERTNGWGFNAGGGFAFPLPHSELGGFVEARYHVVHGANDTIHRFVPITVGVMF